ncbi:hypothetical protein B5X24_HaOG215622 [Helicoverpa armigera]|nr:hypothetical protein B5X24_HaOG215622 [Helicoverpa armigera]
MGLKIAVWLALVACIDCLTQNHAVPKSPHGIFLQTIANKGDKYPVISKKMNKRENFVMTQEKPLIRVPRKVGESTTEFIPKIDPRSIINSPGCPTGYVRVGGFCFFDDYYEY